jgi:hypothetical protein
MMAGERLKVIVLEEVVDTHPKQLRDEADMVPVVEPFYQMDAFAAVENMRDGKSIRARDQLTVYYEDRALLVCLERGLRSC